MPSGTRSGAPVQPTPIAGVKYPRTTGTQLAKASGNLVSPPNKTPPQSPKPGPKDAPVAPVLVPEVEEQVVASQQAMAVEGGKSTA